MTGKIYRFKYVAVNEKGDSIDSEISSAALARLPTAPATPTKVDLGSNTHNI